MKKIFLTLILSLILSINVNAKDKYEEALNEWLFLNNHSQYIEVNKNYDECKNCTRWDAGPRCFEEVGKPKKQCVLDGDQSYGEDGFKWADHKKYKTNLNIKPYKESEISFEEEIEIEPTEPEELPLSEDGQSKLAFLIRIPREGYTKEIARKRILQWRRMGLDVSEAEPALFQDSDDAGFAIYQSVEHKVRRAIELDNRLDLLLEKGLKSDVTKMRFRIRQLTGFDEVEDRIEELI